MNQPRRILAGIKISAFSQASELKEALKGYWVRDWGEVVKLTVCRGHAILSSKIVEENTPISVSLPSHSPFYVQILGPSGVRTQLVTDSLNLNLIAGESLSAIFTLKDTNYG